jgi:hypothetical protein
VPRELKKRVGLSLDYSGAPSECAVLLLRGPMPEFYRPARQALREAFGELHRPKLAIQDLLAELRPHFSICPRDFEPDVFADVAVRDPVKWWLALVQFADQARVLAELLAGALDRTGHPKLKAVAAQFEFCDRTLCGGADSGWFPARH